MNKTKNITKYWLWVLKGHLHYNTSSLPYMHITLHILSVYKINALELNEHIFYKIRFLWFYAIFILSFYCLCFIFHIFCYLYKNYTNISARYVATLQCFCCWVKHDHIVFFFPLTIYYLLSTCIPTI